MADSKATTTTTDDDKKKPRAPSYDERPTLFSTLSHVYGTPLSPTSGSSAGETKLPSHINQWVLVNHPAEMPGRDDAKLQRVPFPTDVPHGSVLVKVSYLTVDPYLRNAFRPLFYGRPNPTNSILRTEGVGQVIRSEHPQFKTGDKVQGFFGWRDYAVIEGSNIAKVNADWPESQCLGALGMPGATAYYGLFEVCKPKPGDVLFVSAASGAVGALVGQLGKLAGCTVIGSVGSADKVKYCTELGFDVVINYKDKDTEALVKEIKEAAPGGIHCYFDNTGGPVTEAVMLSLCEFGRVAVCGQISYYNLPQPARISNGLALFQQILSKRATVQGFLVHQFRPWDLGLNRLAAWIRNGDIKVKEDITDGIENMFDAFLGLFSGQNQGKKLIRLA